MSTEDHSKVMLVIETDATAVAPGMQRVKDAAKDMAQAVGQSAKQAGEQVEAIGTFATGAAETFTRQEGKMRASIQRATADLKTLNGTLSQKFEARLEVRGLDKEKFQPYLEEMRKVEAAQIKATTGLDTMGMSAKATAAAMRGVPAQMTDIITSLQGGQAPLTVMLQQGGQLKDMFGGVGNAAKALGGYVYGLINPFSLAAVAVGVLGYAYYTGSQESKEFNKALLLSGNQAGVTTGQLNNLAAAMGQGSFTRGAAAEALTQFAKSGVSAGRELGNFTELALGMEKYAGQAIKTTADAFKSLEVAPLKSTLKLNEGLNFLTVSMYEQIRALDMQGRKTEAVALAQKAYGEALRPIITGLAADVGYLGTSWEAVTGLAKKAWDAMAGAGRPATGNEQLKRLKDDLANLQRLQGRLSPTDDADRLKRLATQEKSLQIQIDYITKVTAAQNKSGEADAERNRLLAARQKWNEDELKYMGAAQKLQLALTAAQNEGVAAGMKQAVIDERLKGIRAEYAKVNKAPVEQITEQQRQLASYVDSLQKRLDKENELTEVQKARNMLKGLGATGEVEQVRELVLAMAGRIDAEKQLDELKKLSAKNWADYAKDRAKEIDQHVQSAQAANKRAQQLEDEVAMFGLTEEAVQSLTIARLKAKKSEELIYGSSVAVAALEKEILAVQRLAIAKDALSGKQVAQKAVDEAKTASKRMAESIESSLTDALFRGFEAGKGFLQNLGDSAVNMFKTMILRPTISAFVAPIATALTGAVGLSGAANAASTANTISQAGSLAALGSTFGSSLSAGFSATVSSFGAATGVAIEGGLASIATGTSTAITSGLGQIAGALGPYAIAAAALYALFQKGEYVKSTGSSVQYFDSKGSTTSSSTLENNFATAAADSYVKGIKDAYNTLSKQLGLATTGGMFAYAANNSDGGKFGVQVAVGKTNYSTGELKATEEALKLEASRAVFAALKGSDLPAYLAKVFDGVTASTATADQITQTLGYASALKTVREALLETRTPLDVLKDSVAESFKNLGTSAESFKADFVAAIDAGIAPDMLADWQRLGTGINELAAQSKAAADKLAATNAGLQDKLDLLTGAQTDRSLELRDATDATTKALLLQIYAQQDIKTAQEAAAQAQQTAAQAAQQFASDLAAIQSKIASERTSLQDQLDSLTMTNVQLLEKQRNALDGSNRALFDQVQAATRASAVAAERTTLTEQIRALTETESDALIRQRDALDLSNRALFDELQVLTAVANARKITNDLLEKSGSLNIELMRAQGDAAGALAAERALAIKGYNAEQVAIYDANTAVRTMVTELGRLKDVSATIQQELPGVIAKFQTPEQQAQGAYSAIAQSLVKASLTGMDVDALTNGLMTASKASIADVVVTLFNTLPESAADARLALLRAASGLADLKDAATAAAEEKAKLKADQRANLQDQLDGLSLTSAQLLEKQRSALDASNRALFDQVQAAQSAATALAAFKTAMDSLGSTRSNLQVQLLTAQGNPAGALALKRKTELDVLTAGKTAAEVALITAAFQANNALEDQITATNEASAAAKAWADAQAQAAQQAAQAAEQLKAAWQGLTDTMFDEVSRLRGLMGQGSTQSLVQAQTAFGIATAQARAGDQDAARLLPGLSRSLVAIAESQAASLVDLRRIQGQTAASLELTGTNLAKQFGLKLPSFDVGTDWVPFDMVAKVHKGEEIVPAGGWTGSRRVGADSADLVAAYNAMAERFEVLQRQLDAANAQLVRIGNGTNGAPENTPRVRVLTT